MKPLLVALVVALAASCAELPPPRAFADVDYGMGAERDVVVDGVRLRVHEGGVPGAPTIVLLHCFGLNMKVWRDVLPALEQRFHVVVYDAVGHGKSAMGVRRVSLQQLATLGLGLMDELGIQRATLVGNSMGGATALTMALRAPERVSALVFVDGAGLKDTQWFIPLWPMAGPRHVETSAPWTWRFAYALATERSTELSDAVLEDILATRGDRAFAGRNAIAMYSVVDDIFHTDRTADLARIDTPTLVLTGRHDRLVSVDHAERLARGIPGARLVVFEELGHLPEMEDAARVADEILSFAR